MPRRYVLYGGTAIALRFGHRASVDFDFFASENFQVAELIEELPWLHHCQRLQSKPGTLTVIADRGEPVKLSFFGGLSIGRVGEPELTNDEVVSVASSLDLAATKMAVIQQRAEQKDYLDAARLLQAGIQLPDALAACRT